MKKDKKSKKGKVHKTDQTEVKTENVNIKAEPETTTSSTASAQKPLTEMLGEFDFSNVHTFGTQQTTTPAQSKLEKVPIAYDQFQSIMAYVL